MLPNTEPTLCHFPVRSWEPPMRFEWLVRRASDRATPPKVAIGGRSAYNRITEATTQSGIAPGAGGVVREVNQCYF
jgi:hypothetical protein